MKIPFFKTTVTGKETAYISQVLGDEDYFAEKKFVAKTEKWFAENHGLKNFYLTKSCTQSLELAAIVIGLKEGDEVIMPSYAFVSCGNAFALRGAKCVYVDVEPVTMNIDPVTVEQAVTSKTKAILTINYSAVACNYDALRKIADKHKLYIIEDNAHGIGAKHGEAFLGTFGDISTFSFDHLKNITCGQGGGIAINNAALLEKFFIHYEFGTNRRSFFKGEADRYEWKDLGSNFPLSELNAAMLLSQLENISSINGRFIELWNLYYEKLSALETEGFISVPHPSAQSHHNAHCFFIKTKNNAERNALIKFLHDKGINAQFHYTPFHTSEFGKMSGRFSGEDWYTTIESGRLLRLPLYFAMSNEQLDFVAEHVKQFYKDKR